MATSGQLSQGIIKALVGGTPSGQLSQEIIKVVVGGTPSGQLSQAIVKVLLDYATLPVTTAGIRIRTMPTIN